MLKEIDEVAAHLAEIDEEHSRRWTERFINALCRIGLSTRSAGSVSTSSPIDPGVVPLLLSPPGSSFGKASDEEATLQEARQGGSSVSPLRKTWAPNRRFSMGDEVSGMRPQDRPLAPGGRGSEAMEWSGPGPRHRTLQENPAGDGKGVAMSENTAWAYRCGWCGMPCSSDGEPMGDDAPTTDGETVQVEGECCREDDDGELVQVSKSMAMDAGEPEMEGHWIRW